MLNFKRYTMVIRRDEDGFATPALKVRQKGEILKFDEVKEFLKLDANTGRQYAPQMPPDCNSCPASKYVCFRKYDSESCNATLWRHFCRT